MANIKFSAFTQKVAQADVDFLVGYTGADNVRITPAALGDGIYLPLAGGTMTGDVIYNDNIRIKLGTGGADSDIYHNGTDMVIRNLTTAGDMNFAADSTGSGGPATSYFWLDGGVVKTRVAKDMNFETSVKASFGNVVTTGMMLWHDGGNGSWQNDIGDMYLRNTANDKNIILLSDDGAGGTTEYLRVDGAFTKTIFSRDFWAFDNTKALFGTSADLEIYHDGSHSRIDETGTGGLIIRTGVFYLRNPSDEDMLYAASGGAVNLYYDNSKKLETTATGIQVTDEVSIGTSLVHTGDTDTKVSFGTDEIVLTTAGTDRVTVKPDGKVGIGTASPTKKLEVEGNIRAITTGGATAAEIDITSGGTWRFRSNPTSGTNNYGLDIIKGSAGTDVKMSIDTNGNVGIGTATPAFQLEIENHATTTSTATLSLDGKYTSDGAVGELIFTNNGDTFATIAGMRDGADNQGSLQFQTQYGGVFNTKMTIASIGDVGIGDLAPTSISVNTSSLSVGSSRNDLSGALINKADGNIKHQQYWDSSGYGFILTASSGDFKWNFGGSEKMRLTETGITKLNSTNTGNHEANYKTGTYYKLSTGSTTAMTIVKVGHTHAVNYTVIAKVDTSNVGTLVGNTSTAYGSPVTVIDSEAYAGVVTDIAVTYDNSYYGLNVAVTYTGATAPHIWMAVKGQSSEDFVAQ